MHRGNRHVVARAQKHVDGCGESPTSAVPEHDNELQGATQVIYGVFQAAEYLHAKAVTRYPDNEQIVWSLVENEFDWYAGIRTSEHCRKWTLFGRPRDV